MTRDIKLNEHCTQTEAKLWLIAVNQTYRVNYYNLAEKYL